MLSVNIHNAIDFDKVFHTHYNALCFFAHAITKDRSASEDIVSESYLILYKNLSRIREANAIKSYLYRVVRNECLEWLRRKKLHKKASLEIRQPDVNEKTIFHAMVEAELTAELHEAINHLPEQCRKIFKMFYFEEMSYREIAEELHLSVNTIRNQKARAILLLRNRLVIFLICLSTNFFSPV